jgi:hypothetical protein
MSGYGTAKPPTIVAGLLGAEASRTRTGECRRAGQRLESGVLTRQRESAPTHGHAERQLGAQQIEDASLGVSVAAERVHRFVDRAFCRLQVGRIGGSSERVGSTSPMERVGVGHLGFLAAFLGFLGIPRHLIEALDERDKVGRLLAFFVHTARLSRRSRHATHCREEAIGGHRGDRGRGAWILLS